MRWRAFLDFLTERRYLNPAALGTLELHPEFFTDEECSPPLSESILQRHGIGQA